MSQSNQLGQKRKSDSEDEEFVLDKFTTLYRFLGNGNELEIDKFVRACVRMTVKSEDWGQLGMALGMSTTKAAGCKPRHLIKALKTAIDDSLTVAKFVNIMTNVVKKKAPFQVAYKSMMPLYDEKLKKKDDPDKVEERKEEVEDEHEEEVVGEDRPTKAEMRYWKKVVRHETFVFDWVDGDFSRIMKVLTCLVNNSQYTSFGCALGVGVGVASTYAKSSDLLVPFCKAIDNDLTIGGLIHLMRHAQAPAPFFGKFPKISEIPTPRKILEEEKKKKKEVAKLPDDVTVHQWCEGDSEKIAEFSCDVCNVMSDEVELAMLGCAVGMSPLNAAEANEKMLRQKIYEAVNNSLTVSKIVDVVANACKKPTPLFSKHQELRLLLKPPTATPKHVAVLGATPPDTPVLQWMDGELTKLVDFSKMINSGHVSTLYHEFMGKPYMEELEPAELLPMMAGWIAKGATVKHLSDLVCKKLQYPTPFHRLFPDLDWEEAYRQKLLLQQQQDSMNE